MARDAELVSLVDEFLYLVEVGSDSSAADEAELAHLLDRLALALRTLVLPAEPEVLPEIPARNFEVLRKVAASRFPSFGAYFAHKPVRLSHSPGRLSPGPVRTQASAPELANAIEDVAMLADHLHAVAWLWRDASFELGVWYLEESYRAHWGRSMRALQLYLHDRYVAREPEARP